MKHNIWNRLLATAMGLAVTFFTANLVAQDDEGDKKADEAKAQDDPAAEDKPADEPKDEEGDEEKPNSEKLRARLAELREQIQKLVVDGKLDEAESLQKEAAKVQQELFRAQLGAAIPGQPGTAVITPAFPPPGGFNVGGGLGGIGGFGPPPSKEEGEKQIKALRAAAEELREAGLDGRAGQMEQEAKMIEQMLKNPPRPPLGGGIGPGGPEFAKTIEELQAQVKELAQAVKDLQAQVKELAEK